MITLRFESEDLKMHDLLDDLQQTPLPDGVSASITPMVIAKEGDRPISVDVLEILARIDVTEEAIKWVINLALTYAFVKINRIAFAEPHILLRFENGAKRKILYDKGDSDIVEELLSFVMKGDVKSIVFKT